MSIFNKIKKGIVLVVLFQSCNTSGTEKQIIKNEDTLSFEIENPIPSLLKDTFLISNFSVNGLELGMPINNAKERLLLCDSVILDTEALSNLEDTIYYVFYQGNAIMAYNSKNDTTITWIEIYSPIFCTKDGFRVTENIKKVIGNSKKRIEKGGRTDYCFFIEEKNLCYTVLYLDKKGIIQWIGIWDGKGYKSAIEE